MSYLKANLKYLKANGKFIGYRPPPFQYENLISRWLKSDGLSLYKDTEGINIVDKYFFPDNITDGKERTVQEGRGYNFTGLEYIEIGEGASIFRKYIELYIKPATSKIYWILGGGSSSHDMYINFSTGQCLLGLASIFLTSPQLASGGGSWHHIIFDFNLGKAITDGVEHSITTLGYMQAARFLQHERSPTSNPFIGTLGWFKIGWTEETADYHIVDESVGIIAYDASGYGRHRDITLGGSAESSFHITSNEVESVQNELGYNVKETYEWSKDIGNFQEFIDNGGQANAVGSLEPDGSLRVTPTISTLTTKDIIYSISNTSSKTRITFVVSFATRNVGLYRLMQGTAPATLVQIFNGGASTYGPYDSNPTLGGNLTIRVGGAQTSNINDYFIFESIKLEFLDLIPVDQSTLTGSTVYDVLGNELSGNSIGRVQYPALIKGSSVGNFDGILYGSFGIINEFNLASFEINLKFKLSAIGTTQILICNLAVGSGGWQLIVFDSGELDLFWYWGTGSEWLRLTSTIVLEDNIVYTATVKFIDGIGASIEVEDTIDSLLDVRPINYGTNQFDVSSRVGLLPSIGEYYSFEYHELDSGGTRIQELINLNFSETNGLTSFNTAENRPTNSDMSWVLGGSSDGTQWAVSDLQYPLNLASGYSKAGYFDGVRYGDLGTEVLGFQVTQFEYEGYFIIYDIAAERGLIEVEGAYLSSQWRGVTIKVNISLQLRVGVFGTFVNLSNVGTIPLNTLVKVNVKSYGGNVYGYINDVLQLTTTSSIIGNWIAGTKSSVGGIQHNPINVTIWDFGLMYSCKYYELNSGGTRINELINIDWANGNETIVPNIGTDAPTDSDMIWTDGTGAYSNIPADPANPTLDILGNVLTNPPSLNSMISSENTYNRNPMDVPALAIAGVEETEDITYEDITADELRYYRLRDSAVNELLVYSDVGGEPLIVGNMTASEYAKHLKIRKYLDYR